MSNSVKNPLIAGLERELAQLDEQSLLRRRRIAETPCAPSMQVDGRAMLGFCSNDYLGLAAHPRVVEALREGASLYGAGSGASHLISGHTRSHALLEERLAEFLTPCVEQARALYFCTGYMANLAIITALAGSGAEIFSEELNHASLIDGARQSRAKVHVYPHANMAALSTMLEASSAKTKLVTTDSVFSMDGDVAPLKELAALCERHGAWLLIDDAHGFGVLGEDGRGALAHCAIKSSNIVYMGTLSKAAGVGGAFVAAHESVIEWLMQRARPYIYTTAAAPALAHALLASIDIIAGEEGWQRRAHLRQLIAQLREGLQLQRWQHPASETAIQPLIIGANDEAMRASAALYEQGLWVPAIRPPTVPVGTARLRVTLSAAHSVQDVAQVIGAINEFEGRA